MQGSCSRLKQSLLAMNYFVYSLLIFFSVSLSAQSTFKQFKKLSKPERCWVIMHPCKAKKAFHITKQVQSDMDSIKTTGLLGIDNNGGKLDAFKHAYWMASIANGIGERRAWKLGKAHEKGNYLQFKKHQLEDNMLPDSISSVMDLHNNLAGIKAEKEVKNYSKTIMQEKIILELYNGKLFMIKKNSEGDFLNCGGTVIPMNQWLGKWGVPKCIVPSSK